MLIVTIPRLLNDTVSNTYVVQFSRMFGDDHEWLVSKHLKEPAASSYPTLKTETLVIFYTLHGITLH